MNKGTRPRNAFAIKTNDIPKFLKWAKVILDKIQSCS